MSQCVKCTQGFTPARPGVECSRCDRPFHLALECSGLAAKQREALSESSNLGWTCQDCGEPTRRRRSTITTGDEDLEVTQATKLLGSPVESKKLLRDVNTILKKVMKRELNTVTKSLDTSSGKLKKQLDTMTAMKTTVQNLKKNNATLLKKYNHLETRIEALEQRVQEMEQEKLTNVIDIYNLPTSAQDDVVTLKGMVLAVADKLQVKAVLEDVKRFLDKNGSGKLQVTLEDEAMKAEWLARAKDVKITVADILPAVTGDRGNEVVYISEALTPYNKALLRSARKQLKESGLFKYVWCKGGVIRARRGEVGDTAVIRVEDDIKQLTFQTNLVDISMEK